MDETGRLGVIRRIARLAVLMVLAAMPIAFAAQDKNTSASQAVPASRQADNLAVIKLEGAIDRWTSVSMQRRIKQAEDAGADAIVIEIDSPGGEVGAVLEISNAIKGSSIDNTVAWINPDAYSGGAIVALACREIVTSDPASFGDAFPITISPMGIRGLTADERTKILPPLLTDVADSARRSGYDEYLVQAIVVDGIELWGVTDTETNRLVFINENEYRTLFDGEPPRGKPALTAVPEGQRGADMRVPAGREASAGQSDGEGGETETGGTSGESASTASEQPSAVDEDTAFLPATGAVDDVADLISQGLDRESERPEITKDMRGRFASPFYACDGSGPIVMRDDQLARFGFSSGVIETDAELLEFFGAKRLSRARMNWSENFARFLSSLPVRAALIIVFILGVFVEMTNPGTILGAAAALGAMAGLIVPPMIVNMAGWWEILAIGGGIIFILLEVFILPGFGFFGIAGLIALFVGLVGTFIPNGPTYPGMDAGGGGLLTGATTVLLSTATSLIGGYFIMRNAERIPVFERFILKTPEPSEDVLAVMSAPAPDPEPGDLGEAVTALRPSGRVKVGDRSFDAVLERGYVDDGDPIEVVGKRGFSLLVRPASDRPAGEPPVDGEETTA